ncbi:hypothetical protein NDN16_09475 [Aureimonas altamirensis]|uniref:hypothetical protein n=1 Tax=Aureimonas altamirensis TaxID=370622 RepID=UPI002036EEEB|nr:hypothetical protein [Aureimonas altamirensis]MCM2503902.1 hypothetical protein [Aureimonas altamirensis]
MAAKKPADNVTKLKIVKDQRPDAPSDLTPSQAQLWDDIVANEAVSFFQTTACQVLLKEFCRHTTTANHLAQAIEEIEETGFADEDSFKTYHKLLTMRDKETRAISDKATKLRISNQARYDAKTASTAANSASAATRKPWETG